MQTGAMDKVYAFGYGIGRIFSLGERWTLSPELLSLQLYLGDWDHVNVLNRLNMNFNVKLGKYVSLTAGPCFSVYYSNQTTAVGGYKLDVGSGYSPFSMGGHVKGWFGWNAAVNLF
jgi:hypothetical protein